MVIYVQFHSCRQNSSNHLRRLTIRIWCEPPSFKNNNGNGICPIWLVKINDYFGHRGQLTLVTQSHFIVQKIESKKGNFAPKEIPIATETCIECRIETKIRYNVPRDVETLDTTRNRTITFILRGSAEKYWFKSWTCITRIVSYIWIWCIY